MIARGKGGEIKMPLVGSKPEKGIYKCIVCDQKVTVDYRNPILNFCPKCDGINFIKMEGDF